MRISDWSSYCCSSDLQPSVPVEVDAEKLRRFAGSIVMGKADREIVLESLGCFNDVASLATAIGLPEEMVGEQFAAYDRMADAARTEASLLSLLDNDDPDEGAVRSAVATLPESSAYWPTRSEEHTSELQ